MLRGILILATTFGLGASAWGQDYDDPLYPALARDQRVSGQVILDCVVMETGRLDCEVETETPVYWEFGDAALTFSEQWRVESTTHTGESTIGGRLRRMLVFEPGPPARILQRTPPRRRGPMPAP
jgi:TonB family protein